MKSIKVFTICVIAFAAAFLLPAAAHADDFVSYIVNGTFASGGTLSGYFILDESASLPTPIVTDAELFADGDVFSCPDSYSNGCIIGTGNTTNFEFLAGPGQAGSFLLELAWPSTQSYTLTFDTGSSYCEDCVAGNPWPDYLVSGTAVDPPDFNPANYSVATPEPSSAMLLFSGLIALGFIARKSRYALQS